MSRLRHLVSTLGARGCVTTRLIPLSLFAFVMFVVSGKHADHGAQPATPSTHSTHPWHSIMCICVSAPDRLFFSRYMEHGIDIDAKFGGSAAVENLRKWVRSQKTQELERVEGERQRVPGSPPGRPLSEVRRYVHGPIHESNLFFSLFVFAGLVFVVFAVCGRCVLPAKNVAG